MNCKYINKYKGNELVAGSLKLVSSNILLYLLPFIVTPILSRLYNPADFGDWGIFSSTYSIISVILFLGFEQAIVKCKDCEFPTVVKLCLLSSLIIISLFAIVSYLASQFGVSYMTEFPSIGLLLLYLVFTSILVVCQNIVNRREQYSYMAFGALLLGLCQAIFRIIFSFVESEYNGLILGTVVATILNAGYFVIALKPNSLSKEFKVNNSHSVIDCIVENRRFPLFDAPASLFAFAALNLPIIILSNFYGKDSVGCYSMVIQLLLMPISLVGAAVGKVFYARISKTDNIGSTSRQVLRFVIICSIFPSMFFVLGGDKLLVLFLGDKWDAAGGYALCLLLWSIPTILTQPLIPLYRKINKQQNLLLYNCLYFIFGIGILSICCYFHINILLTLFIYSLLCSIVKFSLFYDIVKRSGNSLSDILPSYVIITYIVIFIVLSVRLVSFI